MSIKKILTFFGWPLLVLPTTMMYFGMSLNALCTIRNDGRMPVRIYNCEQVFAGDEDPQHTCMTKDSRMKFLADVVTQNAGMFSLGDMFIEGSAKMVYISNGLWFTILGFCLIRKEKFYWE